jgi:hypothetical protein
MPEAVEKILSFDQVRAILFADQPLPFGGS